MHAERVMGEVCHIRGRRQGAPRFDANQDEADRDAYENLILLCPLHHTIIDTDEEAYTAERLMRMKREHETRNQVVAEPSDQVAQELIAAIHNVTSFNQSGGITAGVLNLKAYSSRDYNDRLGRLLAERNQLELTKIQPRFEFKLAECGEDGVDCLEIYNNGEGVKYFFIREFSFLRVYAAGQTRYFSTLYFYERKFTGKVVGRLVTLAARTEYPTFDRAHPKYSWVEINRILGELRDALGANVAITPSVFLHIGYLDIADNWHCVDYDVMPGYDYMSGEMARPLGFSLPEAYGRFAFAPEPIWRVSGQQIRAQWERYPTAEDLLKEEQKCSSRRVNN